MASTAPCLRELKPLVSRNVAREALSKALGNYVGYRGAKRRYTMAELEEFAGVKSRVIECVMDPRLESRLVWAASVAPRS